MKSRRTSVFSPPAIPSSEITPEAAYLKRRDFLRGAAGFAGGLALGGCFDRQEGTAVAAPPVNESLHALQPLAKSPFSTDEPATDESDATSYNNFYEFGTDKSDPARRSRDFQTRPWTVVVEGEVAKPGVIDVDDLLAPADLEERIYRLRCVEAWSMVIPWVGITLGDVLKRFEPTSGARFVEFETLHDPERMPGQKRRVLDWPYREGLRIDEAMNPLALLTVGMYGKVLPNQNGAPVRLVVPWKYGFKSIKSIVRIRLRPDMPPTSWNQSQPGEYGFYANVNPAVDHPRWSQKRERRIGEFRKRPTLPFNGYGEQVASLYAGMDLRKQF